MDLLELLKGRTVSLDLDRLENPRVRGCKLIARCPACAETGTDKAGEHLYVADGGSGPFGCIAFTGTSGEEHRRRIWELVGNQKRPTGRATLPRSYSSRQAPPLPQIPPLRPLNVTEMADVAAFRSWTAFAGLELLTRRGLLWQGMVWDDGREWPAWIVTDPSRRNAQARRLDGGLWHGIGDKKAKSLPSSDPSWPIGAVSIGDRPLVVLCEGQPDFCAALLFAWFEGLTVDCVAPVCMTGAGNDIHAEALQWFAGKHVRIAIHADNKGREAGIRWAGQLYRAGAVCVDGFHFDGLTMRDGRSVNDLADFATLLDPEDPPACHVLSSGVF